MVEGDITNGGCQKNCQILDKERNALLLQKDRDAWEKEMEGKNILKITLNGNKTIIRVK